MSSVELNFLKIPLYKLCYIKDIDAFTGLTDEELDSLRSEYTESELAEIVRSVQWAVQNENYNFISLLPKLSYSNDEIYKYLCKLERSLAKL